MNRTTSRFPTLLAGLCCGAVLTGAVLASITLGRQVVSSSSLPVPPSAAPTPAASPADTRPPITGLTDLPFAAEQPNAPDTALDRWDFSPAAPSASLPFDPGFQGPGPQLGLDGGLGGPQLPLLGSDPLGGAPSVVDPGISNGFPGDGFTPTTDSDRLRRDAEQTASALLRAPQQPGGFAAPIRLQRNEARLQWQIEQLKRAKQRQDQER